MMLLQTAVGAASQLHPLSGTVAEWVWLLPALPLAGFVINGLLSLNSAHFGPADPSTPDLHHPSPDQKPQQVFVPGGPAVEYADAVAHEPEAVDDDHGAVKRHRWATLTSIIGPGVLILAFGLALAIWQAMA